MVKYNRRGRRMADPNAAAKPKRNIPGLRGSTAPKPKTMVDPFKSRKTAPTRDTSKAVVAGKVNNPNVRNAALAKKNNAGAASQQQAFNQQQRRQPRPQQGGPNQLTQSQQFRGANNRSARLQMIIDENQARNKNRRDFEEQRRKANEPTAAQLLSKRDARAAYEAKKKAEAEAKRKAAAKKAEENKLRYKSMDEVTKDSMKFDTRTDKTKEEDVNQLSNRAGNLTSSLQDQIKAMMSGLPKAKQKKVDPELAAKKAKEKEIIAAAKAKKNLLRYQDPNELKKDIKMGKENFAKGLSAFGKELSPETKKGMAKVRANVAKQKANAEAIKKMSPREQLQAKLKQSGMTKAWYDKIRKQIASMDAQAVAKAGGGYMGKKYVNPSYIMEDRIANKQKAKKKDK